MPDSRALVRYEHRSNDKYSKISLGAFDDNDEVEFLNSAPEPQSFGAGVVSILTKNGVPKKYLKNINVGSDDWLATFREFITGMEDWAVDSALGGLVGAIFGPEFIPMVEGLFGSARSSWRDYVKEGKLLKAAGLVPGTWILINNGAVPPHKKEHRRLIYESIARAFATDAFGMGTDPGRERSFIDEPPEYMISEGFVVGEGDKPNHVRVFNFETFREEDIDIDEISGMSAAREITIESNPILSSIRDLKFEKQPSAKMLSDVPTDPGTEVVFDDFLYHIVISEGGLALIEDIHGQRKSVSLDQLKPGRIRHTNSWNYRKDRPFLGGFDMGSKARVYSGQWVWVPARLALQASGETTHELGVVWKIDFRGVYVVLGIDGTVEIVDQVWPFSKNLEETVQLDKEFMEFKMRAVEGGDTEGKNLGANHLAFCVGNTYESMAEFPTPLTPGVRVKTAMAAEEETVGAGRQHVLEEDARQELALLSGVPLNELGYAGGPDPNLKGDYNGGNSVMAYLVMGGLALLVFNSVDINMDILA